MKYLVICFGPIESLENGYFIRCYNIIKNISKEKNKIILLQFNQENYKSIFIKKLDKNIWSIYFPGNFLVFAVKNPYLFFNNFIRVIHYMILFIFQVISFFFISKLAKKIEKIIISSIFFLPLLILFKLFKKYIVLDPQSALSLWLMREKNWFYYLVLLVEKFALKFSDEIWTISENEKEYFRKIIRVKNIKVVPHKSIHTQSHKEERIELDKIKVKIIFVGDLTIRHNFQSCMFICQQLAPVLWRKFRDKVKIYIIGRGDYLFDRFKKILKNVKFLGFVKDLDYVLKQGDIFIVPLWSGAGVKTKVLDFLKYNKPIITTEIGIEGINVQSSNVIVVDSKEKFINKVKEIIKKMQKKGSYSNTIRSHSYGETEKWRLSIFKI